MYSRKLFKNGILISETNVERESKPLPVPKKYNGAELWKQLHIKSINDGITNDWLSEWSEPLPAFGCSCKSFFLQFLHNRPLPATNQFEWSFQLHNNINAKLGKPLLSLEDARDIWTIDILN